MPLQIRRGLEIERQAMSVALAPGELLYTTDSQRLYVGNGNTLGGVQISGYTNEDAQDAAASLFTNGVHSGITFNYGPTQDAAGRIDVSIDLSSYNGIINASSFKGTLVGDDSTILVDGVSNRINLSGTVQGHIIPNANEQYDLGSSSFRFRDLYLSGTSIKLGNATITASGSAVVLPAGSTINGNAIGDAVNGSTITGNFVGDLQGSVFGDDSTILVDGISSSLHTLNLTLINNTIESDNNILNIGAPDLKTEVDLYQDYVSPFMRLYGENDPSTGDSSWINFYNSRGTLATPLSNAADDTLSGLLLFGHDGTGYSRSVTIAGRVANGGTITAGKIPGELLILVQSDTIGVSQQMKFDYNGVLSVPVMQTGVYTTTPTDGRPTGVKGMIIFNDTSGKFQGFDGTIWVDLS